MVKDSYCHMTSFDRRNFMSSKIKDMYEKPSGDSTSNLDSEEEKMDIRKLLKEIEHIGSSHMSWKERKERENQSVVTLGGKPPKNHRVPLGIAKAAMKKQKERDQKALEEGLILGKFGTLGKTKNKVENYKPRNQVLKPSEGHFKDGVLNVKHLLRGASSSRKDDEKPKFRKGKKKKGHGKKGRRKHRR